MRSTPDIDVLIDRRRRLVVALGIAGFVIAVDQVTKAWAVRNLSRASCSVPDACIDIIGSLRFRLSFNPGAAFSSFTGGGPVLGVIAFVMSIYLIHLTLTTPDRWLALAFPLVAGGAVGNLIDRVARADDGFLSGEVVDFIDLQFWPIFNVADIAVVGGVATVAVLLWRQPPSAHVSDHSDDRSRSGSVAVTIDDDADV